MFKKNYLKDLGRSSRGVASAVFASLLTLLICVSGCRTPTPFPQADLEATGWSVREGQAIWRSDKKATEIAGEITVAINKDGRTFVQFTKTPIPFIVAQSSSVPRQWEFRVIPENRTYAGPGDPPARVAWLQLTRCLAGNPPARGWRWKALPQGHWRLENNKTGEFLEGYLTE